MVFWAFNTGLPLIMVIRGVQVGLVSRYPLFYIYLTTVLASTLLSAGITLWWGTDGPVYFYSYQFWNLVYATLHFLLIWSVFKATGGGGDGSAGKMLLILSVLVVVASAPVALAIFRATGFVLYSLVSVLLPAQMIACIFVYCTALARRVNLGLNRKGLLAGLSLMVGFQSINYARYFVRESRFEEFAFLVPLIYLFALSVFAVTHWNYDPVRYSSVRAEKSGRS